MRFLITEAASHLAYHVTGLLASEAAFAEQLVDIVLCDHEHHKGALTGLQFELQDCVHTSLRDVSVSSDFLESFKSADVVLVLPKEKQELFGHCQIHIDYALLSEKDFQRLDGVFHQKDLDLQEQISLTASGPMSAAVKIVSCLRNIFLSAQAECQSDKPRVVTTVGQFLEEAEFGIPPTMEDWTVAPQLKSSKLTYENKLLMLVLSVGDHREEVDSHKLDNHVSMPCFSRL